ncbi:UPF0339 protein MA_3316 [Arthrobacter sp. Hiyo4]|nr:UPF0339 protein MA_3316 [Arthrobacter sp. Hiyo4]
MAGKFEIFLDAESQYRFRLSTHDGAVIAASRGFADKPAAVAEISDVHQCAGTALIPDPSSRGALLSRVRNRPWEQRTRT